ncbi:MAG: 4Fe-4S dicluster domain-containing protein, partial [Deltaproteobacteria bacterium]|nr:4Fe-4S dicluster domain-containing protein [Deltaproteobacteria bacterium]
RIFAFIKGFFRVIFSLKIFILLYVFIIDVLLQRRILKESFIRWVMHMFIYGGFMLLLLMHALDGIITASVFSDYASTLYPFFFLRDLFGVIVIAGLVIAVYRRSTKKLPRFRTNRKDTYAIILVAVIFISGFFMEGLKITSYSDFTRMVKEYSDTDEKEEIEALESLWVKEFGLVSPNVSGPFDEEALEKGREGHEMSCMGCHSSPKWAFAGNGIAKILTPVALRMDQAGAVAFMYWLHAIACFIGLAFLPFTKMFHIITTPISLFANSVMDKQRSSRANIATRRVLELDACTHCGTCSQYCSAMMAYEALNNDYILPSEKMGFLKTLSAGKELTREEFRAIQEGVYLCTNCDRCTVVCPSGINLRDLWLSVRENLIQKGVPEPLILSPLSLFRGLNQETVADDYSGPIKAARMAVAGHFDLLTDPGKPISFPTGKKDDPDLTIVDNTFAYCFGCQNCTTVCPVVDNYENPQEALGLLPHQIMCCLGLGLDEMASGPNMLWDCVTCYQCQEHCPQQVKVADILYDLKNMAIRNMAKGR